MPRRSEELRKPLKYLLKIADAQVTFALAEEIVF